MEIEYYKQSIVLFVATIVGGHSNPVPIFNIDTLIAEIHTHVATNNFNSIKNPLNL